MRIVFICELVLSDALNPIQDELGKNPPYQYLTCNFLKRRISSPPPFLPLPNQKKKKITFSFNPFATHV